MNDLLNLFIFAQTPIEELRRWLAETPHRFERYAPGERIIAQGAECRSALLLTAGTANTEMVQDGRDLAIDVLKAPMLLASAFLFGTENRMPVSVTAATTCEVWTVNKEALFGFMLQQPEAMRRFVAEVSDRAQFLSRRLRQLTLQSLRSRVLDFLRERGAMSSVQTAAQQLGVQRPLWRQTLPHSARCESRVPPEGVKFPHCLRRTAFARRRCWTQVANRRSSSSKRLHPKFFPYFLVPPIFPKTPPCHSGKGALWCSAAPNPN